MSEVSISRRGLLTGMVSGLLLTALPEAASAWGANDSRAIRLFNPKNNELLYTRYWHNGRLDRRGLEQISRFFRDNRNGQMRPVDPRLIDIIYITQQAMKAEDSGFLLLSGYRSPQTNHALRRTSSGVAQNSLHMYGMASDLRPVKGSTSRLRDVATRLGAGGVGTYSRSGFIHLDSGPSRTWGR